MASNAKALSFLSGDLSLSGTEVSINVAGSVQSNSITGSTITMKNTGSTIVASDGTTAVLSESGGVVTLTADTAVIEGSSSGDLVRITQTGSGNALVVEDSANPDSTPFVVGSSGNVILGVTTLLLGGERLRVAASGSSQNCAAFTFDSTDDRAMIVSLHAGSGTTEDPTLSRKHYAFLNSGGFERGSISVDGTSTTYNTSSDYRLKENITKITDGITRVKQLNPSRFNFIANPDNTVDGFLAHEVQGIVPEAISGEKDAVNEDGSIRPQGIDQSKLVPLLTAALQEAIALIESQQSQIDTLTAKTQEQDFTIASLISRIEALENP